MNAGEGEGEGGENEAEMRTISSGGRRVFRESRGRARAVVRFLMAASLTVPLYALNARAQEAMPGFGVPQLVRLDPKGILPVEVSVQKGASVIWLNATRGYVTVVFSEGDGTVAATQSPTRFFMAPDGTFTSNAFGPGAVASLAFLTVGKYRYFVSGVPGDAVRGDGIFGTVIVRNK